MKWRISLRPVRRRASLVVPGSAPEKLARAAGRGADELVIDLEDAVAASAKADARAAVVRALGELDFGATAVAVRVNAPGTPWHEADVAALAAVGPPLRSLVVPKVDCPEDLAAVEPRLAGGELRVQALIETAAGLADVSRIAAASPRLEALILGYADLGASLGRSAAGAADPAMWDTARELLLLAARAHGLQAIDGPWLGLAADAPFEAAARRAADQGLDGKWAIHPAQIAPLVALFTPTRQQVAHAQAVIAALGAAERDDAQGAVALDGQMLDEAVRLAAVRVLARAETPAP